MLGGIHKPKMASPSMGTPVWTKKETSGFYHNIFIMYHGTTPAAAESILTTEFRPSSNGMLGKGIYFSKDVKKTAAYANRDSKGGVVFKVLVYAGRTKRIDRQGHELQMTWHSKFDTAWTPPGCGMVPSGMEENCVKCKEQIRIIGVVKGYNLLSSQAQRKTRSVQVGDQLDSQETAHLNQMTSNLKPIIAATRK